jgi:hypothetical protein
MRNWGIRSRVLDFARDSLEEKTIMKNIGIVALLAAVTSLGALVACGGSSPPANSPDNSASSAAAPSAAPAESSAAPSSTAAPK